MDGVLADMEGELVRHAEALFGADAVRPKFAADAKAATPDAAEGEEAPPEGAPGVSSLHLTTRQQRRLWRHVGTIENFWETLKENEPGSIAQLAAVATERRWEVIFLTKRPPTAGATAQVQTQRWLESQGFRLPSVYVVQGSRGRIAAALGLDFVVDDRPENCLDVVVDSTVRAILVWREDETRLPAAARRLGIGVVSSTAECLDILAQLDSRPSDHPKMIGRVLRRLGLKEPARV